RSSRSREPEQARRPKQAAALLERARAETQGDCRQPCTPFPAAPFLDAAKEVVPLLAGGIFNPSGPTLPTILLARTPPEADWILLDVQSNPFAPTGTTARGWQPATLNPAQLRALLTALQDAPARESPLFLTQSSYVVVFPGALVG